LDKGNSRGKVGDIIFTTGDTSVKANNIQRDNKVSICIDDQIPPFSFVTIFGREYNLKYLGGIGNVFDPADIDAAIANEYDIIEYYLDYVATNPPLIQGVMGLDPGWGTSSFGIVITITTNQVF
jgi:hypothetical protein